MTVGSSRKRLFIALAFLLPNLLGFLVFTAGPVAISLWMSLTDRALTKHNKFSDIPVRFIGVENYERLLWGDESRLFWDYFGNTAFLMLGIPVGIAGSLLLALLLNAKVGPQTPRTRSRGLGVAAIATVIACLGVWMLTTPGPRPDSSLAPVMSAETGLTDLTQWSVDSARSNAAIVATASVGVVVALGLALGPVFFRTIFYLPSLLAGVAMFLLWKTLYRPRGGLINAGLDPLLDWLHYAVNHTPAGLWSGTGFIIAIAAVAISFNLVRVGVVNLVRRDAGVVALLGRILLAACIITICTAIGSRTTGFPVAGLAGLVASLPTLSAEGFDAPSWLVDPRWAKTALIIMGVWCGIGGGNMLLYLAGLANIPPELYEAASIDGATGWQRFKHVTWPQLAPTTFFIVIMSTIGGLQGGFEQAMVMTQGKADTIVLAYYLYNIAFTDQFQLGLASAIAWVMFAVIFIMTILNFRIGSRLTND